MTSVEISNPVEIWDGLIKVDLSWIRGTPETLAAIAEAERLLQELENKIQNAERVVNDQENPIRENQVSISNLNMEKKASQAALAAIKKENDEQNRKLLEIIQNTDNLKKEAAALRNILDKQDKDYKSILDKIKVAEGERIKLENAKALAEVSIREMEKKRSELNNSTESEKARFRKELDELETKLKKARDDELEAASNFALASSKIPEDVDLTIRALGIAEAEIENQEKTNDLLAKSM